MSSSKLVLECLNGPLDGHRIELEAETEWRRTGEGPLAFPWDAELGDPQARFTPQDNGWWIEGYQAPHGTYRLTGEGEKVSQPVRLSDGDVLKASQTWLLVRQVG